MSEENKRGPAEQSGGTTSTKSDKPAQFWDFAGLTQKIDRVSELLRELSEQAGRISPEYKHIFDDSRAAIDDFATLLQTPEGVAGGRVTQIVAPMPGVIMRVDKKAGAKVAKGDTLLILDAMKVENPIRVPVPGNLISVRYGAGERVAKGAVLAVINHSTAD